MIGAERTKRKAAYRFTTSVDIDLLKEVMFVCPYDAPYGQAPARWDEVVEHMRGQHGPDLTATGCRKRMDDLLVSFKNNTVKYIYP